MTETKKVGAPIGNQNNKKEEPAESVLYIRCKTSDKAKWVKLAESKGGLSAWVTQILNSSV